MALTLYEESMAKGQASIIDNYLNIFDIRFFSKLCGGIRILCFL